MSLLISLNGAQNAVNTQLKQRAAKLQFLFRTADANAADWATLKARMAAVSVQIVVQGKNGSTLDLIPKITLDKVAQLYSANEGVILCSDNGANHDTRFSVELGTEGALALDSQASLVANITGMVAGDLLEVYGVDFPIASQMAYKQNPIAFDANSPQVVNLRNASHLHLPIASFDNVEITYPGGVVVKLEAEEIKGWCIEGNQAIFERDGAVTHGYLDYYSINTADALSAKVTLTSVTNGYVTTYENPNI